ncbi:NUDIX hydrolase [Kaistia sp. 32K]|uniref:NUDIX hydrolase n=1 Tax=Kaistia sp. 32K TaxID=2795690 RepID=UPI00191638EE|nr:NUDIX hydrolase [Kaistia sp. 32K]BCP53802.1 NUDIX hydrolase [Kaistia sp. 32K]
MSKPLRAADCRDILFQVAALPYRINEFGKTEILVLTSRETQRFIIPKGWPMKTKSNARSAAIEAEEEAGVRGKISARPIGEYRYFKRLTDGFALVHVDVFSLEVRKTSGSWKEASEREQCWLSPAEAALLIDEPELASLVRNFNAR